MRSPIATWNDFSTGIIQRHESFGVSSNFVNDEEQTKAQLAILGQETKSLRSELRQHRSKSVEQNPRKRDPNQKGKQNATRFYNYCRKNRHTTSWCRKKIRDEELKRIKNERTSEKRVTFTLDYSKKRGPGHGSEQWTTGQDFRRRNQTYTNDGPKRNSPTAHPSFPSTPNSTYGNNNPNSGRSYDQRPNQSFSRNGGNCSRNGSFNNQNGNW